MLRKLLFMAMVCLISAGTAFAQSGDLSGTITDAESGEVLPGANVLITELSRGSAVNASGEYEINDIPAGTYQLRVTYIGYNEATQTVEISAGENVVDIALQPGVDLGEVVVTALGQEAQENSISFSSQGVSEEQLNLTQDENLKNSLAGKIAGIQMVGQAGSKLGEFGDIRIRGAISLTNDLAQPLYVVDGVPVTNPNIIDMNNVSDVNVLKGPNASALYGQRGENGVIIITTKSSDRTGVSVELNNSFTIEQVAYLPDYQNKYGQGYGGQGIWDTFNYVDGTHPEYFEPLDGVNFITEPYADESWGPEFDGREYAPWYSWFPDSPYYGETETWDARPDNVKNFFDQGITNKSGFAINSVGQDYSARVSYTNLAKNGLIPYSSLDKHYMSGKFNYDVTDKFSVGVDFNYTLQDVNGDVRSDGYGNQTSGSFNSWFARDMDMNKMRELKDLTTPEGYQASWNWWGPNNYVAGGGYQKPTFWFNPYTWMEKYDITRDLDNLLLNMNANYQINDQFEVTVVGNTTRENYHRRYELPYTFEYSGAPDLYNEWANSFGVYKYEQTEYNFSARVNYSEDFGDISVDGMAGSTVRDQHYDRFSADMSQGNTTSGGLIIPNVYQFSNSAERVTPVETNWDKRVYSLYGKATIGYNDYLYLDGTYRQDWSSALPSDRNGYGYPSVGLSFVFSEFIESDILSYGKLRTGWAQVGNDVDAESIVSSYRLSGNAYTNPATGSSVPLLYTDNISIDPDIKPAINSSFEAGFDLRFLNDRIGLDATYYNEQRNDEIVEVSLSSATGTDGFLTNAGTSERQGVELTLDAVAVQTQDFRWDATLNWATNETIVTSLPKGLETYELADDNAFGFVFLTHKLDEEWGQIRGAGIQRNDNGQPVLNDNGLYAVEQNQFFGSVLPDWTGGFVNTFSYKNLSLSAAIDFQKGGKFFSLTEQWGTYSGLFTETANNNDKGNPKRDPVAEGGGVHVTGVDASGDPVDMYVKATDYYMQWYSNRLAEPFIHDADFIKLREVNLNYQLPQRWFNGFINSATVGVVGRNLWMIALAEGNVHGWDPSELAETFGENGQLPGTRSYGFNVKVTF